MSSLWVNVSKCKHCGKKHGGVFEAGSSTYYKPRNVPITYKEPLERELRKMEAEGIISPIENRPYGTPLVVVLKNYGTIRICGDYKATVNRHLEEVKYPLPRVEDIFAKLHKGNKFSKID